MISEEENKKLEDNILQLKLSIFSSEKVILHSRNIRRCEGYFQKLFDLGIKKQFYEQLDQILRDTEFIIVSNAVKKLDYIRQY